jgi:hypothetical protein
LRISRITRARYRLGGPLSNPMAATVDSATMKRVLMIGCVECQAATGRYIPEAGEPDTGLPRHTE